MTEVHVAICKLIYAYFTTEIILKQLFTSVSVIIGEYSPRLHLGEYSPIITSTSVNNCELLNSDAQYLQNDKRLEHAC